MYRFTLIVLILSYIYTYVQIQMSIYDSFLFYIVLLFLYCLISTLGLHLNFVVLYNDNKDHSSIHSFIHAVCVLLVASVHLKGIFISHSL